MLLDTDTVSQWYVSSKGLKVYRHCPHCQSTNVVYRKAWMKGYYGVAPECPNCQRLFPVRMKPIRKKAGPQIASKKPANSY